jgi:D-alanyl-D-alanine dipeptidase
VNLTEQQAKHLDQKSLKTHSKGRKVDITIGRDWPKVGTLAFDAAGNGE